MFCLPQRQRRNPSQELKSKARVKSRNAEDAEKSRRGRGENQKNNRGAETEGAEVKS